MDFKVYTNLEWRGLQMPLSNSLWNIAVENAPYRTGNLRAQIKRAESSNERVVFIYNEALAPYLHYLEEGMGPIKKYQGFIEKLTVGEMVYEIIQNAQTWTTTYFGIPSITLSKHRPMFYERKALQQVGINPNTKINAFERATLGHFFTKQQGFSTINVNSYQSLESPNIRNRNQSMNNRFLVGKPSEVPRPERIT